MRDWSQKNCVEEVLSRIPYVLGASQIYARRRKARVGAVFITPAALIRPLPRLLPPGLIGAVGVMNTAPTRAASLLPCNSLRYIPIKNVPLDVSYCFLYNTRVLT